MMKVVIWLSLSVLHLLAFANSSVVPTKGSPPDTCNSCCQGPAGLPGVPGTAGAAGSAGIPGSPGNNGLPGRDGMKGEAGIKGVMGEHGVKGERGLPGPQGPSGDRGHHGPPGLQGVPGKVGPRGLAGIAGTDGRPGVEGAKGQKGEMGMEARLQRSAFAVAKTSIQTGSRNDIVTFDEVETNIGGHFSLENNKFTCQVPGTYVMMFTISSASSAHDPYIDLVKEDAPVARVLLRETDGGGSLFIQGSQSVVLQLSAGNQVWLRFGSTGDPIYSSSGRHTTFSGFLLYEE